MERYKEYKDSGVQWLGEIPIHWKTPNIGRIFDIKAGGDVKPEYYSFKKDEGHPYPVYTNTKDPLSVYAYTSKPYFKEHTITVTGRGEIGRAIFRKTPYDAIIRLLSLSPKLLLNCEYFTYFINVVIPFTSDSAAIGQLSAVQIKPKIVTFPTLTEQNKIVSYLNFKTSKIDAYIAEKEKEIQLLNELKESEIAKVVTQGLNPDVKMKDSGISWIGRIPEHWEVKQLRAFLKIFSNKGHANAQLLSVTREQGVILRDKENKEENHNYVPDDLSGYKYIEKGDFVINKMKAWQGSYAVSKYDGIVSPAYFTCKLTGVNKDFFSLAIRSKAYVGFFTSYSKGIRVGQWDLDPNALKSIPFFLPPVDEQLAIVAYITEKCSKITSLISELQSEIDYLKEYKQRLIADCVTGQVNVQNETI